MNKTYEQVKNTIECNMYKEALEYFLQTNGADITSNIKERIRDNPDEYVLFGESEDGLEVSLKDTNTHEL
ncbi:hypothetical protein [Rhizosphaericola mali]|uniref:Uncharacterized protein n=1 Tax=Rhizosphaericola mali TaxID=2545455 RepID=A0A5P2FZL1_9BACT|nr:hypothetical protein [Rhizosphaericola mali]QES88974.1 hypothetical protein E0W69_010000 [Rhizosphaericola mali]